MIDDSTETEAEDAASTSLFPPKDLPAIGDPLGEHDAEALADMLLGPWPNEPGAPVIPVDPFPNHEVSGTASEASGSIEEAGDDLSEPSSSVDEGTESLFGAVIDVRNERAAISPSGMLFPEETQAEPVVVADSRPLFVAETADPAATRAVGFVPADEVDDEPERRRVFLVGALLALIVIFGTAFVLFAGEEDGGNDVATVEQVETPVVSPPTTAAPAEPATTATTRRSTTELTTITTAAPTSAATAAPDRRPATTRRPATSAAPATTATTAVPTTAEPAVTFAAPTWTATTAAPTTAAPAAPATSAAPAAPPSSVATETVD